MTEAAGQHHQPGGARAIAAYGSWRSPISAQLLAESVVGLGWLQQARGELFWVELRPLEDGRYVVVLRTPQGGILDAVPRQANARTLVHEYGGGMYVVHDGGDHTTVVYSEFADQRLYRVDLAPAGAGADTGAGGELPSPRPITPTPPSPQAIRYADGCVSPDGLTLIVVRERHDHERVVNELVAVPADGSAVAEPRRIVVLAGGHDFYAAPRLSPDGTQLAWLSWDEPRMPWDGTELWVAGLPSGATASELGLLEGRLIAGGPSESVLQPAWGPDGQLYFISDRTGWWNLYQVDESATGAGRASRGASDATALAPLSAEFTKPPWVFGLRSYDFMNDGRIIAAYSWEGTDRLGFISPGEPAGVSRVACDFTTISWLKVVGDRLAVIAGSATRSPSVALIDPASGAADVVRRGRNVGIDPGYVAAPEPIAFPTSYEAGCVGGPISDELAESPAGLTAHALYYPPTNKDHLAPAGERPPLIVMSHGGPTSAFDAQLSFDVQYWTSRGIAVVAVNYGGSTGYGRRYRERLKGNWGIVDTVDCINAAKFLVERGDADPSRIAVEGGSAGGYTTLNALTRSRFFAAGTSLAGLADLEAFASGGTHKFEAHYLFGLVAPYPERAGIYRQRSPINHVDDLSCPVILLQGLEDAIVPPAQAEIVVSALAKKGLPYAYLAFPGEQHGLRKAPNIIRSYEAVLYFYGRVFGFVPADEIEPVEIHNLG